MVVLDAMEKCAGVQVLETELNDSPGVCLKLYGPLGDIQSAARAAEEAAARHADRRPRARHPRPLGAFARRLPGAARNSVPSLNRQPSKYRRTI